MKYLAFKIYFLALALFYSDAYSQSNEAKNFNCFSILIGNEATMDGSVMLVHNEDDWGDRVVNWYKVPKQFKTFEGDSISFKRGHKIAQTAKTNAYLWLEIPELEFSDSYLNEYGVVVVSNACKSREDKPELVSGGIGYWLRRIIAERAKTAREAVEIAGALIDNVGYAASGRTYSIADTNETWMLSVVNGKHWVAQRIPNKHLAIIPNYYTITNVDLSDEQNFLGSPDLIEYAIERSWYDPNVDEEFNFRKAYSDQDNLENIGNKARYWVSINAFSQKQYKLGDDFPFSFMPKKNIELEDVFEVMRNHYEGTDLYDTSEIKGNNPHKQEAKTVCSETNQYGFVAQLRNNMPVDVGALLWFAPRRPCTQAFIPIYSGLQSVPDNLAVVDYDMALDTHFNTINDFNAYAKSHEYLVFDKKAKQINANYKHLIIKRKDEIRDIEKKLLAKQKKLEKKLLKLYNTNPKKVRKKVTHYFAKYFKKLQKNAK